MKIYIGAEVEFVEFVICMRIRNDVKEEMGGQRQRISYIFIDYYAKLFILWNTLLLLCWIVDM